MEAILERMQKTMTPFDVTFELTYDCNIKCVHCYQDSNNKKVLNTDEVFNILEQLSQIGCFHLAFTGGEIFLRKDLFEIVERASNLGFAIKLLTNATMITEEIAKQISKYKKNIQYVEISIYGSSSSLHDKVTRQIGSFDKTISAVHYLKKHGVKVKCKTPVMTFNYDDFDKIREMCEKMGVKYAYSVSMYPTINGDKRPTNYRISSNQLDKILEREIIKGMKNKNYTSLYDRIANSDKYDQIVCGAATRIANISPNGDVTPCILLPTILGNLKEESLEDIWYESSKTKKFRNIVNGAYGEKCKTCESYKTCPKCLGLALMENSDYYEPSEAFCNISEKITSIVRANL